MLESDPIPHPPIPTITREVLRHHLSRECGCVDRIVTRQLVEFERDFSHGDGEELFDRDVDQLSEHGLAKLG